ncbi:hypothetical protein APHAL10511_003910 [Amanita phalloides]|nr:hypothetical protein APHAL10511_003910 [Amanita phalloides]
MSAPLRRAIIALCDLSRWPFWLSRWIGYREMPSPALPMYKSLFWSFVGTFCGVALIQGIFGRVKTFVGYDVPPIVYSYGSAALVAFATLDSPTAQPRAFLFGHIIGALTGVSMTKLFSLMHNEEHMEHFLWLTATLSCSTTLLLMKLTNTVHPPAGATSILAAITPEVRQMGWILLPIVIISSLLMMSVALIVNNIEKQYPLYWMKAPTEDEDEDEKTIGANAFDTRSRAWLSDTTLASAITMPQRVHLPV